MSDSIVRPQLWADLETTLFNYLKLYNHHIPQRAIGTQTPIQALKEWQIASRTYSLNAFTIKRD